MKDVNRFLPFIAILLVLVMFISLVAESEKPPVEVQYSDLTPQLSFAPQGFKRDVVMEDGHVQEVSPRFDARLAVVPPLEAYRIPRVEVFSAPLGTENGSFSYNAQEFWSDNPHRGGRHSGDDLNGIGGGNSDEGDPVYSVGDGLVVYVGEPSLGWGNVVLIAHRVREKSGEERFIQSLYGHLKRTEVVVGQRVSRGAEIGSVGTAGGHYLAHLHFEMREGLSLYIGPGYLSSPGTRLSPSRFLCQYLEDETIYHRITQSRSAGPELEIENPSILLKLK